MDQRLIKDKNYLLISSKSKKYSCMDTPYPYMTTKDKESYK